MTEDWQMFCVNCGEPIRWSLDSRRWLHDGGTGRVRYCVSRFDEEGNPTTEAEPLGEKP